MLMTIAFLTSCATTQRVSDDVRTQLAPTGKLRVGLNFGNILLVTRGNAGADPSGLVVDIARELGTRIGIPVQFVSYDRPGLLADAAKANEWDIAFLAIEPARAEMIDFSPAYVEIDASYLVRKSSPLRLLTDVDKNGVSVAVSKGSAYDLFLTRSLKGARLLRTQLTDSAVAELRAGKVDAVAGIKQMLLKYAETGDDLRIIDERFLAVQQAMGTPRGREAAAKYLASFVGDIKHSGFLANAMKKNDSRGLSIAP